MTDKIHPATKSTVAAPPIPKPPPRKTQLNNPSRTPPPAPSKHLRRRFTRRRCLCLACFWSTLLLLLILVLASIAAAAFYVLYRPHKPSFSVTSLRMFSFNLTTTNSDDTTRLTTKFNLTLFAKNPNKKMSFLYDPVSITVQSNSVKLSDESFTRFTNAPDSIAVIHTALGTNSQVLEAESVSALKSDLKKSNGLRMRIVVDTMVGVKIDKLKMKKIGIRVTCGGIQGLVPKGKHVNATVANVSKAKCKADLRFKIFRWTFSL